MNWTLAGLIHTDKPRHTEDEWNQLQKPQTIHTEGLKKIRSSITVILSYNILLRQRHSSKKLKIQWWPYYLLKSTHHFTSWFWHTGVAMRCCTQMKKARPSQTFCSCALLANFGVHLPLVDYVQRREIAPPRTGKSPSRTDRCLPVTIKSSTLMQHQLAKSSRVSRLWDISVVSMWPGG